MYLCERLFFILECWASSYRAFYVPDPFCMHYSYLYATTERQDSVFAGTINRYFREDFQSHDRCDVYYGASFATFVFAHIIQSEQRSLDYAVLKLKQLMQLLIKINTS